ncbi:MAG: cytochrome c oxidase subunit 3, partial [Proteobacteria bacterium]|nr:cytochrome c oxidase subunit 3 [Pseudomonadota bacterium]
HVLVGSLMLMFLHWRLTKGDFTRHNHFYFEATAWYWHFVDVVWIGLFLFVYVL